MRQGQLLSIVHTISYRYSAVIFINRFFYERYCWNNLIKFHNFLTNFRTIWCSLNFNTFLGSFAHDSHQKWNFQTPSTFWNKIVTAIKFIRQARVQGVQIFHWDLKFEIFKFVKEKDSDHPQKISDPLPSYNVSQNSISILISM